MSFRRKTNAHDRWLAVVRDNAPLLADLPPEATVSETAFRDYVTLDDLWTFINRKRQFDMEATLFDDFNEAFRLRHLST